MPEKPYSNAPTPSLALNALDLALEMQKMEAEMHKFVCEFLPLLDDVEMLCRDLSRAPVESVMQRAEALAMLADQADRIRTAIDLERIGEVGEIVDADRYHVVDTAPRQDKANGTVLEVNKYGWSFRGHIIRQARVVASVRTIESAQERA
jgi:molecular chaperone GrpE (heat shock protein)